MNLVASPHDRFAVVGIVLAVKSEPSKMADTSNSASSSAALG